VLLLATMLPVVSRPWDARAAPTGGESSPEARRAAKAHLDRGGVLIDRDDLRGALAEFEAAYRLVPSPNIFHNFGIVYEGLGRKADALTAFQRFLAEAPAPSAEIRQHAERAVTELTRQVARLTVEADVPGAEILIDGQRRGSTPLEAPIWLDPGSHLVSVEEPGSGTVHSEQIRAEPGRTIDVRAPLRSRLLEQMPSERLARPPAPAAPSAISVATPAERPAPVRRWQRPAAWTSAALGVLALGLSLQQGLAYNDEMEKFNNVPCYEDEQRTWGADCRRSYDDAHEARNLAIWSGIAGGALAVTAAVLFLTLPDPPAGPGGERSLAWACAPAALGLGCRARF
jgi:tetratricopeptide (TPR) repeat protein